MTARHARFAELDTGTLYAILKLRSEVFVVEQSCAYLDPDGHDVEAEHWWIERDGTVATYLRVLSDADGYTRIGRVVTAEPARRQGLAASLLQDVLNSTSPPWRLAAQTQLVPWYEQFGFGVCGAEFDEDGIGHTPMERATR